MAWRCKIQNQYSFFVHDLFFDFSHYCQYLSPPKSRKYRNLLRFKDFIYLGVFLQYFKIKVSEQEIILDY